METRWKSCSDMLYLWCLNKLMHHQFGKFIHTSASHTCYQPRAWTWLGRTPSPAPITESDLVYHTGRHETQPSCGFTSSQNPYILHINSKSATPVVFKANYVWKPETQFTYHPKIFARPLELLESLVVYVSGWHVRHVRAVRSLSDTMDHMFKRCPVSSLHDWMKIMTHMHAYAQVCSQQTVWMPDMPGSVCYSFKTNTATFMHECGTKNQSNNIELIASKACNMTLVIRASSHIHSEFSFSTWNPPNDAICRPCGKPTDKKKHRDWTCFAIIKTFAHATSLPQTPAITPFSPCQWRQMLERSDKTQWEMMPTNRAETLLLQSTCSRWF